MLQLQAQIASWCPTWEPKAEELLTDVGTQTALMGNADYPKLGPSVERLSSAHEQLASPSARRQQVSRGHCQLGH